MLSLRNIDYTIAGRTLLATVNLQIASQQHIGLIGRNGSGKSTLFKIIQGDLLADSGQIECAKHGSILTVKQQMPEGSATPLAFLLSQDSERLQLLQAIEQCQDTNHLATLYDRLLQIDAYTAEARAAVILKGLGFSDDEQQRPLATFSGGFRMRVALAAALFQQPDLLLLDEPTNHLDLETTSWLQKFLQRYPKSFLLISHDRDFLNQTVNHIFHLKQGKITSYSGNFEQFLTAYQLQQQQIQAHNSKIQQQREHMLSFVNRFRALSSKAKQAQSRLKSLEKLQLIPVATDDPTLSFQFPEPELLNPPLLSFSKVTLGYGDRVVLSQASGYLAPQDRIALVGANGQGKTTLARFLAGELTAKKGVVERHRQLTVAFYHQALEEVLTATATPYSHIAERWPTASDQQLRKHLGRFGFSQEKVEQQVSLLSGGEQARLLFACLTIYRPQLLILDEPTNHLDMEMRESLMAALNRYPGAVLLISHDRYLLQHVADRLWIINQGTLSQFAGDLNDYEQLQTGKSRNTQQVRPTRRQR
ncbi:MAG: ABC-F family ATP-binding cassette domain-containing protein [Candidatus Symbiodolus clandestinus]